MFYDKLYIEITRNCTLNCEHCLKGEKENKNMSVETINNIFKDIKNINTLLLTGGEPLINIKLLQELVSIINDNKTTISTIGIITNGTIYSKKHIEVLKSLKELCNNFQFYLSSDLFHRLEWNRLSITNLINNNYDLYNKYLELKKFLNDDSYKNITIYNKGKAKFITDERIKELKRRYYIDYKIKELEEVNELYYDENKIYGKVFIDVNGNLVDFSISYDEEDNQSDYYYNVNNYPLKDIIYDYIDEKNNTKVLKKY